MSVSRCVRGGPRCPYLVPRTPETQGVFETPEATGRGAQPRPFFEAFSAPLWTIIEPHPLPNSTSSLPFLFHCNISHFSHLSHAARRRPPAPGVQGGDSLTPARPSLRYPASLALSLLQVHLRGSLLRRPSKATFYTLGDHLPAWDL